MLVSIGERDVADNTLPGACVLDVSNPLAAEHHWLTTDGGQLNRSCSSEVHFSRQGRYLLTGSHDGSIHFYDAVDRNRLVRKFCWEPSTVTSICPSPWSEDQLFFAVEGVTDLMFCDCSTDRKTVVPYKPAGPGSSKNDSIRDIIDTPGVGASRIALGTAAGHLASVDCEAGIQIAATVNAGYAVGAVRACPTTGNFATSVLASSEGEHVGLWDTRTSFVQSFLCSADRVIRDPGKKV